MGAMRWRSKRRDEGTHTSTPEEVLEVLELMPMPASLEAIVTAVDANRGALRGGLQLSSASAVLAALEQLEHQGVAEAGNDSLRPEAGPTWWLARRWAERRQQQEERRAAAERAAYDRAQRGAVTGRAEDEISEALREERANGGSPLKRAVDATLAANERKYKEYLRHRLGAGGGP